MYVHMKIFPPRHINEQPYGTERIYDARNLEVGDLTAFRDHDTLIARPWRIMRIDPNVDDEYGGTRIRFRQATADPDPLSSQGEEITLRFGAQKKLPPADNITQNTHPVTDLRIWKITDHDWPVGYLTGEMLGNRRPLPSEAEADRPRHHRQHRRTRHLELGQMNHRHTESKNTETDTTKTPEQTRTHTLTLPYDKPPLSANDRFSHWAVEAKTKRNIRRACLVLAKASGLPRDCSFATITLHYAPKDNRRRDPSNLMPTQKACLDGLVDYGLVPDDSMEYVEEQMPKIHPADKTPHRSRMWLEITVEEVVA